jgi:predicted small secreted protein
MMKARSFMKGIGIGVAAGALLTAAVVPMDKKRLMRSKAGRTIRSVGTFVEGVRDAFA